MEPRILSPPVLHSLSLFVKSPYNKLNSNYDIFLREEGL